MKSPQLTKAAILQAAFLEWGQTNFTTTGLAAVAKRLGVTKTALYRHFKNKDHLLEEMKQQVLTEYLNVAEDFVKEIPHPSLKAALERFYSFFFTYFLRRPEYFMFFILFIAKQQELAGEPFLKMVRRIIGSFQIFLGKSGAVEEKNGVYPVEIGFLVTIHTFWLSLLLHKNRPIGKTEAEQVINNAVAFTLNGIYGHEHESDIDWKDLLRICEVKDEELLPQDRIFSAIADTVAADGLWNTTLEKIASQLNMRKSSLYFYFKNKEAMFSELLERERNQIQTLYEKRKSKFHDHKDRLFCYLLVVTSYLLKNPALLTTFNWIRLQGIRINMQKPDLDQLENSFAFIEEEMKSFSPERYGLHPKSLVSLYNMQIVREIMNSFKGGFNHAEIFKRATILYHCFFYGIGGKDK